MKTDQKIAFMRDIEERLELILSRFDSALWLEQVFEPREKKYTDFFDEIRLQKKTAQKELRNLRKRLATAHRKEWNEKEGKQWRL